MPLRPQHLLAASVLVSTAPGYYVYASSSGTRWGSGATTGARPNVLMVVIDDMGWQDVGFHDPSFHTPELTKLASEGVELTSFYTSPSCTPSRSQLMTGRYNFRVGMQDSVLRSTEPRGVPLDETMLPEKLQGAGYQTAMVGKWHLGYHMRAFTPTHRGFDRHYGILTGGGDHFTHESTALAWKARHEEDVETHYYTGVNIVEDGSLSADNDLTIVHTSALYTSKALEYLEDMVAAGDPWFLYLSYQVSRRNFWRVWRCSRPGFLNVA